jgi:hypothetical protein
MPKNNNKRVFPSGFRWLGLICLALSAGLTAIPATADESDAEEQTFFVQGFGTVGMARTTSNDVEYVRDLSQPRGIGKSWSGKVDDVLGLQATWKFAPQLEAVVQATSRYRYDGSFNPDFDWAYVKYEPTPSVSLRAGRLGTEFFMLSDSRWVGYSFLTVRPPGDYFWYLPFYTIHGGDVAMSMRAGEGVLRGKLFYGLSDGKVPIGDQQWDVDGSRMAGGYLEYQYGGWQVRASYSNLRIASDLPITQVFHLPASTDFSHISAKGKLAHYYSFGAVYDSGPWQLQLMLNHIEQRSKALESSDGGYALAGYRIADVTPYIGLSWVQSRKRDIPVTGNPVVDFVTPYTMSDSHSDQKTSFVGFRWDFMRNMDLKVQWDAIRGEPSSLFPYRQDNRARWDGSMNVYSLTMDFIF